MFTLHKNNLLKYSTSATAFLCFGNEAEAQVIYTDLIPDHHLELEFWVSELYDTIDINEDGVDDFFLSISTFISCGYCTDGHQILIDALNSNSVAYHIDTMFSACSSHSWPIEVADIEDLGDTIGDEDFKSGDAYFNFRPAGVDYCPFSAAGVSSASFKYAPIQLNISGLVYYGWIRLSFSHYELSIHDYAFNANPGEYLEARIPENTIVNWEYAEDISNNGNGTDLAFSFLKSDFEELLEEYRVIAVEASEPELTTFDALALDTSKYLTVIPDGSDSYALTFLPDSKDINGNLIANGNAYILYVLSVAQDGSEAAHKLSAPSEVVNMGLPIENINILAFDDIADNGNASDILLEFSPSPTEEIISEYRIMLSENDTLSLDSLLLTPAEYYLAHTPDGSSYSNTFTSDTKDINGELITYGRVYYAYVLMIDNGLGTGSKSMRSNSLFLNGPTGVATEVLLYDIGSMGNITDVLITFDKATDESTVQTYRTMLVPESIAPIFDLAFAESLTDNRYFDILPDGEHVAAQFPGGLLDVEGNAFQTDTPYIAFVLSLPSIIGSESVLSDPSPSILIPNSVSDFQSIFESVQITYAEHQLQILLSSVPSSSCKFSIHTADGRKCFESEITKQQSAFSVYLQPGIYIFSMQNGQNKFAQKIITN